MLSPDFLLSAYASGLFPMALRHDRPEIAWLDPPQRGILPLNEFHISRSLARSLRRNDYQIMVNADFAGVLDGCADRQGTWINSDIRDACIALHARGYAHTLEVRDSGRLIGGVYGIAVGAAFLGESMFSVRRDASKIALAYLVERLGRAGFTLFDIQYCTAHLISLGAIEIPRATYLHLLAEARQRQAIFTGWPIPTPQDVIQRNTQTS